MTDTKPRIYTAGAMDWVNDGDSYWRESVEVETDAAEFLHPHESYFDHGGDHVLGAVAEDMAMINRSDAVVALFSETPQVGTITEVVHAAATGTPVLALFDDGLVGHTVRDEPVEAPAKPVSGVNFRAGATDHWFLVNYLTGDDVHPHGTTRSPGELPQWVRPWRTDGATVVRVDADNTAAIVRVVEEWIESGFEGVETPEPSHPPDEPLDD